MQKCDGQWTSSVAAASMVGFGCRPDARKFDILPAGLPAEKLSLLRIRLFGFLSPPPMRRSRLNLAQKMVCLNFRRPPSSKASDEVRKSTSAKLGWTSSVHTHQLSAVLSVKDDLLNCCAAINSSCRPVDNVWAMMIVPRIRVKVVRSVLCCVWQLCIVIRTHVGSSQCLPLI